MKKNILIGSVCLLFLIVISQANLIIASDDDSDGIEDDYEEYNHRTIEVEIESGQIHFESVLDGREDSDEFGIGIENRTGDGLQIELSYDNDSESGESELEFAVQFNEIIEYIDVDGDGIYNSSIDTQVGASYLIDSFQKTQYQVHALNDGNNLHQVIVNTTDGIFTVYIYLLEEFGILNGSLITPSQIKIDIEINGFSFGDPTSQLALKSELEASVEFESENETEDEEFGYSTDEASVQVFINETYGYFSWAEVAEVDEISKSVNISNLEHGASEDIFYLSYAQGQHILHDPKIGIKGLIISPQSINDDDDDDGDKDNQTELLIYGFEPYALLSIIFISISLIIKSRHKLIIS